MSTSTWHELVEHVERIKPKFVAIDTLADIYRGNESIRTQALAFVRLLRTMAIKNDLGAATLGHPSLFRLGERRRHVQVNGVEQFVG
jgi:RecA-family ATPase